MTSCRNRTRATLVGGERPRHNDADYNDDNDDDDVDVDDDKKYDDNDDDNNSEF